MEPYNEQRFHLVLAHGIRDCATTREKAVKFWSTRFPRATITDFPFLPELESWSYGTFGRRVWSLNEAIERDRRRAFIPDESLPRIFICHDLGGSLVKQVLANASENKGNCPLANDPTMLIFCNTPEKAEKVEEWEQRLIHLLAGADLGSSSPCKVLKDMASALENTYWEFSRIYRHHSTINISSDAQTKDAQTISLPRHFTSLDVAIESQSPGIGLWDFIPGDSITERLIDWIDQMVNRGLRLHTHNYCSFLRHIGNLSPGDYQVRLFRSNHDIFTPIVQHPSYQSWNNMASNTSNVLYINGPKEAGNGSIASHLIGQLADSTPDLPIISFAFCKQDQRTLSIRHFYVSLIRQLLLSRPFLFRQISGLAELFTTYSNSGHQILRKLLLGLLKAHSGPVICVIYGAYDCPFPLHSVTWPLVRHRNLGQSVFKMIIFDVSLPPKVFIGSSDCVEIDLPKEGWPDLLRKGFIQTSIEKLAQELQLSSYTTDKISAKFSRQDTFLQTFLRMRLLATAKIGSTKSAIDAFIDNLPLSLDKLRTATLEQCQYRCQVPLAELLLWISYSTRPLNLGEIAVIVSLMSSQTKSIEELKANLPTRVERDIRGADGILFRITGYDVRPIHPLIASAVGDWHRRSINDPDRVLFSKCLDYLDLLDNLVEADSKSGDDAEYAFLSYAVVNWPCHYMHASKSNGLTERVVKVFQAPKLEAWSLLYHKYADQLEEKSPRLDTMLKVAARFGILDLAYYAIQSQNSTSDIPEIESQPLEIAVHYGHKDLVTLLLRNGAKLGRAVCLAAEGGHKDILETILDENPESVSEDNSKYQYALEKAVLNGYEETVSYLLDKTDTGHHHFTISPESFNSAAKTGQKDVLQSLCVASTISTETTRFDNEILATAAAGGFDDVVEFLLQRDCDSNHQNADGMTALHLAITFGHRSTCEILVQHNANIHIKNNNQLSPIHISANEGDLGILRWLIKISKDYAHQEPEHSSPEPKSTDQEEIDDSQSSTSYALRIPSPIELAASNGHIQIVRELLRYKRFNGRQDCANALPLAAMGGFAEVVEELLQSSIDTTIRDANGNTALHLAAHHQYPSIVKRLLQSLPVGQNIFDIESKNKTQWTALHLGARSGRLLTVQVLLQHGAKPDNVTDDGQTALHIACSQGHINVVKELLKWRDAHSDHENDIVFHEDNANDTAFIHAIKKEHREIAKTLIEWPSIKNRAAQLQGKTQNALIVAVSCDSQELVQLLLEHSWDIDKINRSTEGPATALHRAARDNNVSMIDYLLQHKAEPNMKSSYGETPLHDAVRWSPEGVKLLLQMGADVNAETKEGVTPLWLAAYDGQVASVQNLLTSSLTAVNLEARKTTTLWTALHAAYDNAEITQILLQRGANPIALDNDDEPPYFWAIRNGYIDVVRLYMEAGVKTTIKNAKGFTGLHMAVRFMQGLALVQLLVEHGADVNAIDGDGTAPIHLAAAYGQEPVLEYLLQKGANAGMTCKSHGTPLMAAASKGKGSIVEMLLRHGVKVDATSEQSYHYTSIQAAAANGQENIVELLLKLSPNINQVGGADGTPLCAAVGSKNLMIVQALLEYGADINLASSKGTPLELAISAGSPEIVDLCFQQKGLDVNVVSEGKFGTALLAAISQHDLTLITRLLENNANPNLFNAARGERPIQMAVRKDMRDVLEILVEKGADLSCQDIKGRGVLSYAISWNSIDVLPYLCDQSIDVNDQDNTGQTPLILSTIGGIRGFDVIGKLLELKVDVNHQDRWGKTALMYAVTADYAVAVSRLIDSKADVLLKDIRGRDALYWAVLSSSQTPYKVLFTAMRDEAPPSHFQNALNAAAAANRADFAKMLLNEYPYRGRQVDDDGWTAASTALRYQCSAISALIHDASKGEGPKNWDIPAEKSPTAWHEKDMSFGILRHADGTTLTVELPGIHKTEVFGTVRADHGMIPKGAGENGEKVVYYFEVKIEKQGKIVDERKNHPPIYGVGFCEEKAPLDVMLGWKAGTWAYHGDDGGFFHEWGFARNGSGMKYGVGDTIGCGVNFETGTAFFTLNGVVLGQAFNNIKGKLYPAVCVDLRMTGCEISAKFWDDKQNGNRSFKFKGPWTDPKTFEPLREESQDGSSSARDEVDWSSTESESDSDS